MYLIDFVYFIFVCRILISSLLIHVRLFQTFLWPYGVFEGDLMHQAKWGQFRISVWPIPNSSCKTWSTMHSQLQEGCLKTDEYWQPHLCLSFKIGKPYVKNSHVHVHDTSQMRVKTAVELLFLMSIAYKYFSLTIGIYFYHKIICILLYLFGTNLANFCYQ